jgi:hypothetical protein
MAVPFQNVLHMGFLTKGTPSLTTMRYFASKSNIYHDLAITCAAKIF